MRIVCVSDTHGMHNRIDMPIGDILIHCGDVGPGRTSVNYIQQLNEWFGAMKGYYKHILFTPGNHDFPFQTDFGFAKSLVPNCTLLFDEEIVIDGVKFYGSPWQPWFHNWAFNVERGPKIAEKWNRIPDDVDVLFTHGPPAGYCDMVVDGEHVGCVDLLKRILKIKPKYHIFGHIHEAYGVDKNEHTTFINASICDLRYDPVNKPVVFDIEVGPEGVGPPQRDP